MAHDPSSSPDCAHARAQRSSRSASIANVRAGASVGVALLPPVQCTKAALATTTAIVDHVHPGRRTEAASAHRADGTTGRPRRCFEREGTSFVWGEAGVPIT